jgi:phosphoribosyl 1,2-cyclic phosphodiesterase
MSARLTVLASGSSGNATLLQADGFGLLIDCGISARQLGNRLALRGLTWRNINAVILTHTHSDHWCHSALKALALHAVPLYCHSDHVLDIEHCDHFAGLHAAGLIHHYSASTWLDLTKNLRVLPHEVSHDADPTFAFRCEGSSWAVGYAADLGEWDDALVETLANADVLALEFNHDVRMQKTSGRPRFLIDRVLGAWGHLSNQQGAALVSAIREQSQAPPSKGVVTLHRSRQCNTPELVEAAAKKVLRGSNVPLHLAEQSQPTVTIELEARSSVRRGPARPVKRTQMAGLFGE